MVLLRLALIEKVRLCAADHVEERLELKPAAHFVAYLAPRNQGMLVCNLDRLTGALRQQLRLATAVHGDEPPDGRLDTLPYRQQPVVAKDDRLRPPERLANAVPF